MSALILPDADPRYILERTLPDGQVKTQGPTTRRQACGLAARVIADNLGTTNRTAIAVARQLDDATDGETVAAHGYTFRLIREATND
jgi:hypothetical protein